VAKAMINIALVAARLPRGAKPQPNQSGCHCYINPLICFGWS
jgi:hypothetical protein